MASYKKKNMNFCWASLKSMKKGVGIRIKMSRIPNTALTPIGWRCCPAGSSPRRRLPQLIQSLGSGGCSRTNSCTHRSLNYLMYMYPLTPLGWCCCPAGSSPRRRHSSSHPESRIRGVQQDPAVVLNQSCGYYLMCMYPLTPVGWCCCPAGSSPRWRHSSAHPESRIRGVQQDPTVVPY